MQYLEVRSRPDNLFGTGIPLLDGDTVLNKSSEHALYAPLTQKIGAKMILIWILWLETGIYLSTFSLVNLIYQSLEQLLIFLDM